jgi:hypothetical protein
MSKTRLGRIFASVIECGGRAVVQRGAVMQTEVDDLALLIKTTNYETALAEGNLAAAFVAILKGTGDRELITSLPDLPKAEWHMAQSKCRAG